MILEEQTKAPDFSKPDQNGNTVSLSSFKGKRVILYFYPKDDTPGCTIQANDFTKYNEDFKKENTVVIGISKDSVASHDKFCKKFDLTIDLVSDEDMSIINDYGIWQEKNMYGKVSMGIVRTTYLIDEEGTIIKVWKRVRSKGHAEKVLDYIRAL